MAILPKYFNRILQINQNMSIFAEDRRHLDNKNEHARFVLRSVCTIFAEDRLRLGNKTSFIALALSS